MNESTATERVIRKHLQTFLESKPIEAILEDYDDSARFHSESRVYEGKDEIGEFFAGFLGALPPGAVERFRLRNLRVDGNLAFITWSVGNDIMLGTDTFVVANDRIVSQTFSMCVAQCAC